MKNAQFLVACVPADLYPEFPAFAYLNSQNTYTKDKCDECQRSIWLGTNSKSLSDSGVPKVCIFCAVQVYGMTKEDTIHTLTGRKNKV